MKKKTTNDKSALGENNGNNGTNIAFYELTAAGNGLNAVVYGLDDPQSDAVFNEVVSDAVQTFSGFAVTGTSTLSTEDSYAFFMNLTTSGSLIAADTLTSRFDPALQTNGRGIVQAADNDYIILGAYESFHRLTPEGEVINNRAGEALFMKVTPSGRSVEEVHYGSVDGLLLPDNKIMVLAGMDFGGGVELVSLIKTNDSGKLEN